MSWAWGKLFQMWGPNCDSGWNGNKARHLSIHLIYGDHTVAAATTDYCWFYIVTSKLIPQDIESLPLLKVLILSDALTASHGRIYLLLIRLSKPATYIIVFPAYVGFIRVVGTLSVDVKTFRGDYLQIHNSFKSLERFCCWKCLFFFCVCVLFSFFFSFFLGWSGCVRVSLFLDFKSLAQPPYSVTTGRITHSKLFRTSSKHKFLNRYFSDSLLQRPKPTIHPSISAH